MNIVAYYRYVSNTSTWRTLNFNCVFGLAEDSKIICRNT